MNRLAIVLAVTVGAFVYLLMQGGTAGAAFDYQKSWDDAVEEARSSGKPILLNFGGDW